MSTYTRGGELLNSGSVECDRTMADAVRSIAMVLSFAGTKQLDITMLCSSLRSRLRADFHEQIAGKSFEAQLDDVLRQGRTVRALIWNEVHEGLISPGILSLARKAKRESGTYGRLDIRISGTDSHWDCISHFICAHDLSGRRDAVMMRIEAPHQPPPIRADVETTTPCPRSVVLRGRPAAIASKAELADFEQLFGAVGDARQSSRVVPAQRLLASAER